MRAQRVGGTRNKRTHLLQLLQHLVMLAPQLRPPSELVLATRSGQVAPDFEVGLLQHALLADLLGRAQGGSSVEAP